MKQQPATVNQGLFKIDNGALTGPEKWASKCNAKLTLNITHHKKILIVAIHKNQPQAIKILKSFKYTVTLEVTSSTKILFL